MPVLRTDKWLEKSYDSPSDIHKKIVDYFDQASSKDIVTLLTQHGMYSKSEQNGEELLKALKNNRVWDVVKKEEQALKIVWNGSNIPIFILPSDTFNRKIMQHYKGKSGLAFKDKLFLFVSEKNTTDEIKALFTHEYNHCCRLKHDPKDETDYQLLDVIILEGLAENAVRERLGNQQLAPWTSYYSKDELKDLWENLIQPNKDLLKTSRKSNAILYGMNFYPKMAGYCVGYYLVNRFIKKTGLKSKDLLSIPAEKIAQIKT